MTFKNWIILIEMTHTILEYSLFLMDIYWDTKLETKTEIHFYSAFITEVLKRVSTVAHYINIWFVKGFSFSVVDFALFMLTNHVLGILRTHIRQFLEYIKVSNIINTRYIIFHNSHIPKVSKCNPRRPSRK